MRLLVVSNLYPPYWVGGYEQMAAWTVDGLRRRGHQVRVLTGRGEGLTNVPGVEAALELDLGRFVRGDTGPENLARATARHVFSPHNFAATRRAVREWRPDLVSVWNLAHVSVSPLAAARRAGVATVLHVSDTTANPFRNPNPPGLPAPVRAFGRRLADALLRRASRIVVPSRFLADKLVGEGLADDRIERLAWPVEPSLASHPQRAIRRDAVRRWLFVGALHPTKGPDVLLAAFRDAARERPELKLTLVGDGPLRAALETSAAGLDVSFAGRVERPALLAAYDDHDALALSSVWDEPLSLVPLEAMARGLPVVASAAGGTPEVVSHERTGLLVPPGDAPALSRAIVRLSADPALAARLATAARDHVVREHSFEAYLDRIEQIYERIGQAGKRPST